MNHGQSNPNIKPSTVIKSQPNEKHSQYSNDSQTDKTTKIITVKKTSLTKETPSSWTPEKKLSLQENSWKIMNPSSTQKRPDSSYPVFFWEVLITVALLVMALWMQGLPTRQVPQNTNSGTVPSFEMTDPEIRF
ncbi:hypothetical protein [Crocosphaera chwakensis]|uniref:Uncharacterized protein n=1 Tax=Crocosphaera chwakensis CCY0110 TaxID=391612 RepID=A3IMV6_9CHRO|nr:hypothetical protein [Crocosphaera chwakensis]EAZ92209.1 hypothetical protein CY0110_24901 [Crocosphaera chwakensis CCY0110]